MTTSNRVKTFIAAGGLDPSGGAGLAADIMAAAAQGVIALPVATSLTSQSSSDAVGAYPVETGIVVEQLETVYEDFRPAVMKVGLAGSAATAAALAAFAGARGLKLVVDPVARASAGIALIDNAAWSVVREALAPAAFLLTPNAAEATALTDMSVTTPEGAMLAAERLFEAGGANVLVTGGHLLTDDRVIDTLYNENGGVQYTASRSPAKVRGTGCALASAAAARLALGDDIVEAVTAARAYVAGMIAGAAQAGKGALQRR